MEDKGGDQGGDRVEIRIPLKQTGSEKALSLDELLENGTFTRIQRELMQLIQEIINERAKAAGIPPELAELPSVADVIDRFTANEIVDDPDLQNIFKRGAVLGIIAASKGIRNHEERGGRHK